MEITNENYVYYLPKLYINSNYNYVISTDYIQVQTNNNCTIVGTTRTCNCFRIYPEYNYITSNTFSCSLNTNSYTVNYSSFSSDIYNSPYFPNLFIVFFIIIFIFTYILKLLFNVFRKRSV